MLEKRIQSFVSTTTKMLSPEDDSGEVQADLAELEKKWSTFQMQVGQAKNSIELSIVFYKLVDEVSPAALCLATLLLPLLMQHIQ